jgi:amidohydrolase
MTELTKLRRLLHSQPELAGREETTAQFIQTFLEKCNPDHLITDIGGLGMAAVFHGNRSGPRVLFRCELDALQIPEAIDIPHGSKNEGVSHKCGHDGHMVIMAGLAMKLRGQRPERGSAVLLFQPSEETGEGAELVLNDPKYEQIHPDYVFAMHNLPGFKFGEVVLSDGLFASASSGLEIHLRGDTSHAAEPYNGKSPALAVAQLIEGISSIPQFHTSLHESAQATIIHADLGEVAFGTSPGCGSVMATLRSHSQKTMDTLIEKSTELAIRVAAVYDLRCETAVVQPFPVTRNNSEATAVIRMSAKELGMETHELTVPFAWSEDFGHFTAKHKGALFGLGSGENQPALHHPEYDFPDELIESGVRIYEKILRSLVGKSND